MLPSSCVTPAGTSIEVQNEWEENTHSTAGSEPTKLEEDFPGGAPSQIISPKHGKLHPPGELLKIQVKKREVFNSKFIPGTCIYRWLYQCINVLIIQRRGGLNAKYLI